MPLPYRVIYIYNERHAGEFTVESLIVV